MPELRELEDIIEPPSGRGIPKEDIQIALQAIQAHQILYEDTHGAAKAYRVIRDHKTFFEKYFDAAGRQLVVDRREGLVAIMPGPVNYAWRDARLPKEETMVLLSLRYMLEAGFKAGQMTESGRVEATTDDLHDAIKTITGTEPPVEGRMREILQEFRRRGLVRVGERDPSERLTPIVVLPGVRLICNDEFTRYVVAWAETNPEAREEADVLDYITARRAAAAAAAEPMRGELPASREDGDGKAFGDLLGDVDDIDEPEAEA